eukprot:g6244.t1
MIIMFESPTAAKEEEIEELRAAFDIIAGEDGVIDSQELAELVEENFPDLCKTSESLFRKFDDDHTGKISFDEFRNHFDELWSSAGPSPSPARKLSSWRRLSLDEQELGPRPKAAAAAGKKNQRANRRRRRLAQRKTSSSNEKPAAVSKSSSSASSSSSSPSSTTTSQTAAGVPEISFPLLFVPWGFFLFTLSLELGEGGTIGDLAVRVTAVLAWHSIFFAASLLGRRTRYFSLIAPPAIGLIVPWVVKSPLPRMMYGLATITHGCRIVDMVELHWAELRDAPASFRSAFVHWFQDLRLATRGPDVAVATATTNATKTTTTRTTTTTKNKKADGAVLGTERRQSLLLSLPQVAAMLPTQWASNLVYVDAAFELAELVVFSLVLVRPSLQLCLAPGSPMVARLLAIGPLGCGFFWGMMMCLDRFYAVPILLTSGHSVPIAMDAPHRSQTIREFWSERWNRVIARLLRNGFYLPIFRRALGLPKPAARLATFAVSGLLHVYPIILATASGSSSVSIRTGNNNNWHHNRQPTDQDGGGIVTSNLGQMFLFFLIHGVVLEVESRLGLSGTLWVLSVLFATTPLFIGPMLAVVFDVRNPLLMA